MGAQAFQEEAFLQVLEYLENHDHLEPEEKKEQCRFHLTLSHVDKKS